MLRLPPALEMPQRPARIRSCTPNTQYDKDALGKTPQGEDVSNGLYEVFISRLGVGRRAHNVRCDHWVASVSQHVSRNERSFGSREPHCRVEGGHTSSHSTKSTMINALGRAWGYHETDLPANDRSPIAKAHIALTSGAGTDEQKTDAARALGVLAADASNQAAVREVGGMRPLIALLSDSATDEQKAYTALALANLATDATNRKAIKSEGGLPPLVALMRSGTDKQKTTAALALANLADEPANRKPMVDLEAIPLLVALSRSGTDEQKTHAARALKSLWMGDAPTGAGAWCMPCLA